MSTTDLVLNNRQFFEGVNQGEHVKWEKESQFAIQALGNNEFLGKTAMANQVSLQNAIINVAAIGISLNPALKHAYLVPRDRKVCLDISYMGLLHLAMTSGAIQWGQAKLVYANDEYENVGIDKPPTHNQKTFGVKGDIVGVYCTVKTGGGDYLTEEMDLAQLNKVKAASKAANGPWKNWAEEMMRKTVVKRASKYWPQSERVGLAVDALNQHEGLAPEKEVSADAVGEPCNEDQVFELIAAIDKSPLTVEGFCKHPKINIPNLQSFPSERLEGALNWIKSQPVSEQ